MRRAAAVLAASALLAGCNLPQTSNPIPDESTTTSTTLGPATSTTQVTLPPAEESVRATVTEVIDGDTFVAGTGGTSIDVRMLGINAPESEECYGDEARSILTMMITGSEVVLVAGLEDVDQFGRALREVYLETTDGTIHVNAEMVDAGLAVAMSDPGGPLLKSLEGRAYASGKGMWGTFACGQPEGGFPDRPQVRVAEIAADPEGPDESALGDEWVEIVNEGYGAVSLEGWVLRDESASNRLIMPAGTSLGAGESLRVITGCGSSGPGVIYWCSDEPVWSNEGDTAYLLDNLGNAVERFIYQPPE